VIASVTCLITSAAWLVAAPIAAQAAAPPTCDRGQHSTSDFDGDGLPDAVVGSPLASVDDADGAGVVTVVYGSKKKPIPQRATNIWPGSTGVPGSVQEGAGFGTAVAVAFLDDDDCADLVVGAPGEAVGAKGGAGAAYVVFGAPDGIGTGKPGLTFHLGSTGVPGKPAKDDKFGSVITTTHGLVDNHLVVFGVPAADTDAAKDAGAVVVVQMGSDGAPVEDGGWIFTQGSPGIPDDDEEADRFGAAVALGDGQAAGSLGTIFIGAPAEDLGSKIEAGAVTVLDGPNLASPVAEQWVQGKAPLSDVAERTDRLGNSLAYGSDPATGQMAVLIGAPGEDVGEVHEAGAAHLLDGCEVLADCQETYLTQGTAPISDAAETEDRFGTALSFAASSTTKAGLIGMIGSPGEAIDGLDNVGMVQLLDTTDHSVVMAPIDESLDSIPGAPDAEDRFGSSLTALAAGGKKGWLGLLIVGVPGESGGVGAVVTVPFGPPAAPASGRTKPRMWEPGVGAIPAVDASFGVAVGGMTDSVG
jgi:hypothetical protein